MAEDNDEAKEVYQAKSLGHLSATEPAGPYISLYVEFKDDGNTMKMTFNVPHEYELNVGACGEIFFIRSQYVLVNTDVNAEIGWLPDVFPPKEVPLKQIVVLDRG